MVKGGDLDGQREGERGGFVPGSSAHLYMRPCRARELEPGVPAIMKFPRAPISHLVITQFLEFLVWVTRFGRTKP